MTGTQHGPNLKPGQSPGPGVMYGPSLIFPASQKEICMLHHFSRVQLLATHWTAAHQAPPSMGSSRQESWSGLPCPPPGDLPDPGVKPTSPATPALQVEFLPLSHQGSPTGTFIPTFQMKKRRSRETQVQNEWQQFPPQNKLAPKPSFCSYVNEDMM